MKISIITVTYNSQNTLQDTINSVLQQQYPNIEYIIIDGQSKDNTIDIIKQNEHKFNGNLKWISEPDKGLYYATNKGIKLAGGDIVGILDSDDVFFDNTVLSTIANSFNDQIDAIHANLQFVKQNNLNAIVRTWKGKQYKPSIVQRGWQPAHPTFFVKKKIYNNYGIFNTEFKIAADFELMIRFIEKNKIKTQYINKYTHKMRMGGASTSSLKNIIFSNKEAVKAMRLNEIKIPKLYLIYRLTPKIINTLQFKLKTIISSCKK